MEWQPFSIYSKAEKVFIDGALAFDKATNFMPHTILISVLKNGRQIMKYIKYLLLFSFLVAADADDML